MTDITLTLPLQPDVPSFTLQQVDDSTFTVELDIGDTALTLRGTLGTLARHFRVGHEMLDAFIFTPRPPAISLPDSRPFEEQARQNTRRWSGR